jgi:hypothetical protein
MHWDTCCKILLNCPTQKRPSLLQGHFIHCRRDDQIIRGGLLYYAQKALFTPLPLVIKSKGRV